MLRSPHSSPWRLATSAGWLAAAVFITAALSIILTRDNTEIAAIWPVNAIVLATIIRQDRRIWAPLLGAAYLANAAANLFTGNGWIIAIFCSAGNIVEIVLCAWALTRANVPSFEDGRARDFVRLLIGAAAGAAASAVIATIAITFRNDVAPLDLFMSWFISDGLGLLIFTPIFSVLASGTIVRAVRGARTAQAASLVWLGFALGLAAIFGQSQIDMLPAAPLLLILVAFVLEPSGVALATAALSCAAIGSATLGVGPKEIASDALTSKLHYLQGFLALLTLSGMPAAIALAHRRRLEQVVVVAKDEALTARDALAFSERQFASIAEAARDIFVRYEPDTTMTYVSPACTSVLGYAPEELVGRRMQEIVHPEDLAKAAKQLAAVAAAGAQGPPVAMRMRALQKDGAWRWMEGRPRAIVDAQTGAPLMYYDVVRDVTLQRELELELLAARERAEASERHYRVLADHSPDIIIRADMNGVVRYASPAVRMFGITPEEAIGRSNLGIVAPEDKELAAKLARDLRSGAEPDRSLRREVRVLLPDGSQRWIEGNPSIVRNSEGEPIEFITLLRDVTARRQMEEELVAARERAEDATRAKSDFLANMSHELRTPLNSVIGFSRLLASSRDLTERDRRHASLIETSSRVTLSIVNDVLDFAVLERGDIELRKASFSLRELVAGVRDMMAPLADAKDLMLDVHFDRSISEHFVGDPDRLRQVLINLASNAVKFTEAGAVTLSVSADGDAPGEQTISIAVQDSGIGIPPDRRDAIFERFVRLTEGQRNAGGSGLGLAIAKSLVEAMGGSISLESEIGKGSTFRVTVTLQTASASASASASAFASAPRRILVVDDVDLNRELAQIMLELAGHYVETASDGAIAVALCQDTKFDIILMDVQMPGMDGMAATRAIRSGGGPSADAPIVALTAGALPEQVASYLLAGMNGHLLKPLLDDDLTRAVAAWTNADEPSLNAAAAGFVEELSARFAARLVEDRAGLQAALRANPERPDIRSLVHRLAGSAGSFGFDEIGGLALALDEMLALGQTVPPGDVVKLLEAIDAAIGRLEERPAA